METKANMQFKNYMDLSIETIKLKKKEIKNINHLL